MGSRLDLQALFEEILGSRNVYFQPPSTIRMSYPAIVYERIRIDTDHADNQAYFQHPKYSVTVIDPDPDSEIPGRVAKLPMCSFDRHYTADNLNHDVFNLYF